MDVRRIIPMVGHAFGNRHMTADSDLEAVAPVAEIREADNRLFRHAHEAAQDFLGILHGLDGLAQNDNVKRLVAKFSQTLLQIGLNNVHAARHGGDDAVGVDFDTVAAAFFVFHQSRQQFAVAAAQVQDAAAFGNPIVNLL